ncbi:MAG: HAMP domain-containing histidine kinase, partial [Muribaculaceae bacterium]|nr:HAMP domain-containing histidine kinase [Muribaculaceae bacterium]
MKKQNIILPALSVLGLVLVMAVGGLYFTRYLKKQIYVERTAQLNEITSQVRANLNNSLDSHWNYLTAAVNILEGQSFSDAEDVAGRIGELEELLETDRYSSMLRLLDSQGNCYDAQGKQGVWADIDLISTGEERYTFISDSRAYGGSYWAFVQKLTQPLRAEDGTVFTHAVLLKDVYTLTEYYDSTSYGSQNETYILKSNGTRMHDIGGQERSIQSYNVLKVLEGMEGQPYTDIRAALAQTNTLSANYFNNGEEFYYCVTSLEEYDTLLLFLIPARFVASGTVDMVNTVVQMLLLFALVVLSLFVLAVAMVFRQHSSMQMYLQEQASLRKQEVLNRQLEESNTMLTQARDSAEQAFQIAEGANRAKSSFLSNMSHDIRTPMNAIVGFSSLLARDAENPEKVREYTKKITSSSQHLLGLINDILDISKIEAGKTTLNLSEESMVDLIDGIDGIIRPQMKARGHTFEVYSRDLKHEYVTMDKLRLNQILLNLLSNAVKYTPDGGFVSL